MPGNFTISAACSSRSFLVPSTISCMIFPLFLITNLIVSPCLTSSFSGLKRMVSVMVNVTVRVTALASPAMPHSFCSFLTGPAFLAWASSPCAMAKVLAPAIRAAKIAMLIFFIDFLQLV
eukprot:Amastigsp_a192508_6.p3 type:complete len:120 gc:universal Amastigsp_a192508_6:397-38(-)